MILQDFYDGKAFDAYEFFGAHRENGKIVFRTYAPAASSVKVIGSFNGWKGCEMTAEGADLNGTTENGWRNVHGILILL